MDVPEFDFTIWWRPHRGWGYLACICSMPDDSNPVRGFFQSEADVRGTSSEYPSMNPDYAHREFEVTLEAFSSLCRRAEKLAYHLCEMRPFTKTGGSFFGLRLEWGSQEFIIKWHGEFDDLEDEGIKDLYRQIQQIVGARDPSHVE